MSANPTQPGGMTDDLVVFDLETTGLDPRAHEILEIGAVRLAPDLKELGAFSIKIRPSHIETAMPEALAVNGYTPERWADAAPIQETLKRFAEFGAHAMLSGYNITLDWEFLHAALSTNDIPSAFPYHRLDVFSLAFAWAVKRGITVPLDLQSICRQLSIPPPPEPHQALEDARAAAALLRALWQL